MKNDKDLTRDELLAKLETGEKAAYKRDRIAEWANSPAASEYHGKWIVLDPNGVFLTATDSLADALPTGKNIIFLYRILKEVNDEDICE